MAAINTKNYINVLGKWELEMPMYPKRNLISNNLCPCILVLVSMKSESESRLAVSDSLQLHRLYSPWNSLGQNTGVGSLSLLPGSFPT